MGIRLYLGHPFTSREHIRKWELRFEIKSGIELINPFYDVYRREVEEIDSGFHPVLDSSLIVPCDLTLLENSDGMVAIINGAVSYGTIQEMVYANLFKKPVYSLITNREENHPWLVYHSDEIFTKQKNLEKFLLKFKKK